MRQYSAMNNFEDKNYQNKVKKLMNQIIIIIIFNKAFVLKGIG